MLRQFPFNPDDATTGCVVDSNVIELINRFVRNEEKRRHSDYSNLLSVFEFLNLEDKQSCNKNGKVVWDLGLLERCFVRDIGVEGGRLRDYRESVAIFSALSRSKFEKILQNHIVPSRSFHVVEQVESELHHPKNIPGFLGYYAYALKILTMIWNKFETNIPDSYRSLKMCDELSQWIDNDMKLLTPMPWVWAWHLFDGVGRHASRAEAFAKLRKKPFGDVDDVANRAWNIAWDFTYFRARDMKTQFSNSSAENCSVISQDKDAMDIASSYSILALMIGGAQTGIGKLPVVEVDPSVGHRDEYERIVEQLLSPVRVAYRLENSKGKEEVDFMVPLVRGLEEDLGCKTTFGL